VEARSSRDIAFCRCAIFFECTKHASLASVSLLGSLPGFTARLRLHCAGRTRIDRVERRRAADVQPVSERAAEAQIGDRLRDMDLAELLASRVVATNTILVGVAPAHGAPTLPSVSQRTPSVMLGLGISAKTLLFDTFPAA
jgi:hypothetical protein